MSLFAISDLHIRGVDDPIHDSLLGLMRSRLSQGDSLVLVGDVFDLFVGAKPIFRSRYSVFVAELKAACSRGVRVYYIEGNHDFLLKGAFSGIDGLSVHSNELRLELDGKKFYFSHGDLVDKTDYSYVLMRNVFRSAPLRAFVRFAPGSTVDFIGRTLSNRGLREKHICVGGGSGVISGDKLEYVRRCFRSFAVERITEGFDFVVLGHCHDLDEMTFRVDERLGQYINVGYPPIHGSLLFWTRDQAFIERRPL